MKIVNDDKLIIYMTNKYLKYKNIDNIDKIEEYFKDIFLILRDNYNILIRGFYNIDVYIDKRYGIILELKKEELDFDYYEDQIDMKITFHYKKFLLKINDIERYKKIYLYKKNYYVDNIEDIEFGDIIYDTDNIIKNGKTIENML